MKFLALLGAIFISFCVTGQNDYPYGLFNVRHLSHTDYSGGLQNWDLIFNDDNILYVANNAGILEFNGEQWTKFEMTNAEHPRSFAKSDDGTIYVGGQNEFGKIVYNEKGKPQIEKISGDVDSVDFKDVWDIECIGKTTYFVARKHLIIVDTAGTRIIHAPDNLNIKQAFTLGDKIVCTLNDKDYRINYVIDDGKFNIIKNSEGIQLSGCFMWKKNLVFIGRDGAFYQIDEVGKTHQLTELTYGLDIDEEENIRDITERNGILVASVFGDGVLLFDKMGNYIRTIGEPEGLANAIIHKAAFDQYNNLWLCSDNGISFVEMSSAITKYDKSLGVFAGVTEDLDFIGDTVILATHSDLFVSDIKNNRLTFNGTNVFGMETWQIKKFTFPDGVTMKVMIVNDGIYSISKDFKSKLLAKYVYAWDLHQSSSDPNRIYVGLDGGGVGSMYYKNGEFEYEGNYANTSGDVRSILERDGKVYYTVKNEGVHILDTNKTQEENKLPGLIPHPGEDAYEAFTLEEFEGKILLGSVHGMYEIIDDKLVEAQSLDACRFCEENLLIHRMINDGSGKLWMVMFHNSGTDNEKPEMGYFIKNNGTFEWYSKTFNHIKEDVIFSIKKDDDGFYWFGGANAVYTYNEHVDSDYGQPFQVNISGVYINEETEFLYNTRYATIEDHVFPYDENSIRFEFGANAYLGSLENQYSYYLEGEEETWSKWKSSPFAEYQRLGEGSYTLHLKAKNFYGYESEEALFEFTILPPWYRTWWAYLIYIGLGVLIIYIAVRLSIRRVKAQNERLEQIVEERTAEIAKQNTKLEMQKAEIEEKSNDILDSIKYAERIQTAILPTDETMSHIFDGDHFVLYKPKDIVSGDFYWADRFGDEAIFAAVDCTGHGVPGAFVSIVGFNGLNRTVNEFDLRKPGKILDKLTDLVVGTFAKSESQIKDGMDIALCNINYKTNTISYAGANNPLIIVRNGELLEYKANKQPIGEFQSRVPFDTHEIKLEKGDCIYVFSDGYADQFGGEKGKKFKNKALKQLLLDIAKFDMSTQRQKLNEAFEMWKGDFEQLDDVCILGVKI